jgi:hypothetical protein
MNSLIACWDNDLLVANVGLQGSQTPPNLGITPMGTFRTAQRRSPLDYDPVSFGFLVAHVSIIVAYVRLRIHVRIDVHLYTYTYLHGRRHRPSHGNSVEWPSEQHVRMSVASGDST